MSRKPGDTKDTVKVIADVAETPAKPVRDDACLVLIHGGELGTRCNLDRSPLLLGRSRKCDIQIDRESVSRSHARITVVDDSVVLEDLGSKNGTLVNDVPVREHVLRHGDLVSIGRTVFKFLAGGNVEQAYHQEIYRLTTVDGLTQIYNQRYFMEVLEREISRTRRHQRPLSLLMLDIDHFKRVNDEHGHVAGDFVLRHFARTVGDKIRREDIFARYGGEEFVIILPEIGLEDARRAAEKIRKLVEGTSFRYERVNLRVTVSIGVVTFAKDLREPSDFIKRADKHLYEAKQGGRNRVCG